MAYDCLEVGKRSSPSCEGSLWITILPTPKIKIRLSALPHPVWISPPVVVLPFHHNHQENPQEEEEEALAVAGAVVDPFFSIHPDVTITRLCIDDRSAADADNDVTLPDIRGLPMNNLDFWIRFAKSRSIHQLQLTFHHPFPDNDTFSNPRIPQSLIHLFSSTLTFLKLTALRFPKLDLHNSSSSSLFPLPLPQNSSLDIGSLLRFGSPLSPSRMCF